MSYQEIRAANRRLAILQFLEGEGDYKMNIDMLKMLLAQLGETVSYVTLNCDIGWLNEAGCVTAEAVGDVSVVTVLARGIDVVSGAARIDGIARPRAK